MTATVKMIRDLRSKGRMRIDPDLEALILRRFGTEPYPHTYTEQDLYEQIRKLVIRHNRLRSPASGTPVRSPQDTPNAAGCDREQQTDTLGGRL